VLARRATVDVCFSNRPVRVGAMSLLGWRRKRKAQAD